MEDIECLIVDDEPIARDIMVDFCTYIPSFHIAGICANALEARQILESVKVDLLFLDIHLPVLDGIQFLKTLKNPPVVIFTTSYHQYAVNAFELTACDYLVKPFLLDRFIIAVDKAKEKIYTDRKNIHSQAPQVLNEDGFFIRTEGKLIKIKFQDLVYAEANGNYTKLVTLAGSFVPNMSFSAIEKMLPAPMFKRVHRSFIVNSSLLTLIEGNRLFLGQHEVPIGASFRDSFLRSLGV